MLLFDTEEVIPPNAARAAGLAGRVRYLSAGPKGIGQAELNAARAAGETVGFVHEESGTGTLGGSAAGVTDAQAANALADRLGVPAWVPLYYAVDFQPTGGELGGPNQLAAVVAFFDGARTVAGRPVGCYGGFEVIETVVGGGHAPWGWQCEAWSGGRVSAHAWLLQHATPTVSVPGYSIDTNVVLHPVYGAWSDTPISEDDMNATQEAKLDQALMHAAAAEQRATDATAAANAAHVLAQACLDELLSNGQGGDHQGPLLMRLRNNAADQTAMLKTLTAKP